MKKKNKNIIGRSSQPLGFSDVHLNWAAVKLFVSDVKTKNNLSADDIANAKPIEEAKDKTKEKIYTKPSAEKIVPKKEEPIIENFKENENLEDIVNDIVSCTSESNKKGIYPLSRVHCLFDGEHKVFWFTNGYVSLFDCPYLKKYGQFVPKNSDAAIRIQTTEMGNSFVYPHYHLKRLVTTKVDLENRSDFLNHTIAIAGDSILYQYRDIKEFLTALQKNHDEILEVEGLIDELRQKNEELKKEKDTQYQRAQITKTIAEHQRRYRILTEQQEDLKNITIYIRKQGEMRYAPIVDVVQTRIKSQHLYDGVTVIIDGGPGTGKSTTMIHRLAYLTDLYAIDEDERNKVFKYHLNAQQKQQLKRAIETQRDWMFFSPSKLLKDYLADAMNKEGLKNTSEKVWTWKDYRTLILQENYNLLGETNAPFRNCHLSGTLFFQNSNVIEEFTNYYLRQFREISTQLPQLYKEGQVYEWTSIALNIEERIERSKEYNLAQFVSLFHTLESIYGEDRKILLREKDELIEDTAEEITQLIENNKEAKADIEVLLDLASELENDDEEDADEIDLNENEQEVSESVQASIENTESKDELKGQSGNRNKIKKEVVKWLKAYCTSHSDFNDQESEVYQLMSETIQPLLGDNYDSQIKKITELIVFEQFAKYTKGIKAIMLNNIPAIYKGFRKHLLKSQYEWCDLKLLREIMQRKQGKELHHQEQALLLGFINTLVKLILSHTKDKIKHKYIDAYEEVARPIIGVDEATDFSSCDIYAMQSLLTRDFYSLTISGDMMQRMTPYGIKSWDEIKNIVPKAVAVEMKTSYRQSKKVLEVAKQLCFDTLNVQPNYKAFMISNKVPAPLLFISEEEKEKIEWISKRISEVFRAYGELLPSIAIFVNDKGYVPNFIDRLQNTEFFTKNEIQVLDGTNVTKTTVRHICVYPIDVVKGMEFDVVFFHNIDNSSEDVDLLKRYIYVGISRAAFFLGITLNEEIQELSKYFVQNKDWFKI